MKEQYKYTFGQKVGQKVRNAWANPRVQKPATALMAILLVATGYFFVNLSRAAVTVTSARSGNWSAANTWNGGRVPAAGDTVDITGGHSVTYDQPTGQVAGINVLAGATLSFDPTKNVTLESSKNVIVEGNLVMRPNGPTVNQTLRFIGINEENFVGGGMNVLDSDVGLWVMGAGRLDLSGTPKTAWTRTAGSVSAGATSIQLDADPTGWRVGDEMSIAPTAPGSFDQFDARIITAISGRTVTLGSGTSFAHPAVPVSATKTLSAEVMNLTRNVQIEGTPTGRSHIFIRSSKPQTVDQTAIRYMGPRPSYVSTARPDGAEPAIGSPMSFFGRYALHIHRSGDGSRGSTVTNTVVRDTGNHAYAPHASHGIKFQGTIAYQVMEDAYWWDPIHPDFTGTAEEKIAFSSSNDILYQDCVAAGVRSDGGDEANLAAFYMNIGTGNAVRNCVAVGVEGTVDASGYNWPSRANQKDNLWDFDDNISHNNRVNGVFIWQNDGNKHVLNRFIVYHNGCAGIDHGAYGNSYLHQQTTLYKNGTRSTCGRGNQAEFEQHNVSGNGGVEGGLVMRDFTVDAGGSSDNILSINPHNSKIKPAKPGRFVRWNVKGYTGKVVTVNERVAPGQYDLICWTLPNNAELERSDFEVTSIAEGSIIRVQRRNGTAYQVTASGSTPIAQFANCSDSPSTTDPTNPTNPTTPTPPPPPPANNPPSVNLSAPVSGVSFTVGQSVAMQATAADSDGTVSKVEFFISSQQLGNDKFGEDTTAPYQFSTATLPAGNYSLTAKAIDNQGASTVSSPVTITVTAVATPPPPAPADTTPPTTPANLTATAASATRVNLTWSASTDNTGVTKYQVQRNGIIIAEPTTTSYADITVLPSNTYSYRILAVDAAGNTSAPSATKSVTMPQAPDTQAPSVPTNLQATAPSSTQVNLTWSASTDNIAVAGYRVYRNGTLVGTVTTTSFGEANLTPGTSYSYTVVAFDQAVNLSPVSTPASVTTPQAPGSLYLEPASRTVPQNSTFTVAIKVDTGSQPVNAVQANLTYPQDKLEYVSTSNQGSSFTIDAQTSGGNGSLQIARGTSGGTSVTGRHLVATVTFRATGSGESTLLNFSRGSSILSSTTNQNILSTTTGGSYSLTSKQGDLNGDGRINIFDLSFLLNRWNTNDSVADLNGDGAVNIFDLSLLLRGWEG